MPFDLAKHLQQVQVKKVQEDAAVDERSDTVSFKQILEIVVCKTSILVIKLMLSENDKSLRDELLILQQLFQLFQFLLSH